MDVEYIRLLMEYSDMKYPFVKAKSDPGLRDGMRNINKFMQDHGSSRKVSNVEANRIMLLERQAQHQQMRKQRNPKSFGGRDLE